MAFSIVQKCHRRRGIGVQKPIVSARRVATSVQNLSNCEPATVSVLSNGVRLATEPSEGQLVSLSVVINAGSVLEQAQKDGTANLLQTAAVRAASSQARKLGTSLIGNTTRDKTTYSLTVLPAQVPQAVSILGEVVQGNQVTPDALEAARAHVISGRQALWDVVNEDVVSDFFHSTAYQGTPYQNTAEGEIKSLRQLQSGDLEAYRKANYTGQNIVVAASGAVTHAQLDPLVTEAFGGIAKAGHISRFDSRVPFTGALMHIRDNTTHKIQVAIGYETFSVAHKHVVTLGLLKHLIGSWDSKSHVGTNSSSRLAEVIAVEKLADNFHPFLRLYPDTGFFGVYVQTHNTDSLDDLVYEIFNEYQKLFSYLTPEEFFRAKNALKAQLLAGAETSAGRALSLGKHVANVHRPLSLAEAFYRIDLVTPGDVKEVIDQYFYDVDPVIVAHGNLEELPDYVVMRGWTYWNRW